MNIWKFATNPVSMLVTLALGFSTCASTNAYAQNLEPRSYANTPPGLNFLVVGDGYSQGTIAFDPALPIADAKYHSNTEFIAFARSLDAWGKSAKFDVSLPHSEFSGHALLRGQPQQRDMSGLNDPLFRFSINLYGAPALPMQEFAGYRQNLIVGASLQVSAPLGNYDDTKLVNLGNHRWAFKFELGISKAWGSWTVEFTPSATFFTKNSEFYNGGTLSQAPIYAVQGHVIYAFHSGIWMAFDSTYYTGGRTTINEVQNANLQTNTRAGLTLALPVNRQNSLKLYASTGTWTRTGSDTNLIGIAWQYRYGGGF